MKPSIVTPLIGVEMDKGLCFCCLLDNICSWQVEVVRCWVQIHFLCSTYDLLIPMWIYLSIRTRIKKSMFGTTVCLTALLPAQIAIQHFKKHKRPYMHKAYPYIGITSYQNIYYFHKVLKEIYSEQACTI